MENDEEVVHDISHLPKWAQAFFHCFEPFFLSRGWKKFGGGFVWNPKDSPAFNMFLMPTTIEGLCKLNYDALKEFDICPCIINDCAVLFFDEIDGIPVAFVQENYLRSYQWFDKIDRWLESNEYHDRYFLTKLGFAPTKSDMQENG
jgi:hypothetical protein